MAYSFLNLAFDVLKKAEKPLTYQEIWQVAQDMGLATKIASTGKTPWQSLGAQLYVDVCDNESSNFVKVGKRPARFFLTERNKEISEWADLLLRQIDGHARDLPAEQDPSDLLRRLAALARAFETMAGVMSTPMTFPLGPTCLEARKQSVPPPAPALPTLRRMRSSE